MSDCDGFFEAEGIPYEPAFERAAVRAVLSADFYDPPYKKFLITCWYDTTFGSWEGLKFDLLDARDKMSAFLATLPYSTYEEAIAAADAARMSNAKDTL